MTTDKSVYGILSKDSLFKSAKPLTPGFRPDTIENVRFRDDLIQDLAFHLRPITKGEVPSNLLIFGKPGGGKTMITNLMLEYIVKFANDRDYEINTINIPCDSIHTDTAVTKHIIVELEHILHIDHIKVTNSFSDYYARLLTLLNTVNGTCIFLFDEIDKLTDPNYINRIARLKENNQTQNNVCIIGITNVLTFTNDLDVRTKSSLAHSEMTVIQYNAEELSGILSERADLAYNEGTLDDMVIPLCSALAAQEHGDARQAIELLYMAGKVAEYKNSAVVTEQDVRDADQKIDAEQTLNVIRELPTHSKLVLQSIIHLNRKHKQTKVTTDAVYTQYKTMCAAKATNPLTKRRIRGLTNELDTLGIIDTTKRSHKNMRGITKLITISTVLDVESAEQILQRN